MTSMCSRFYEPPTVTVRAATGGGSRGVRGKVTCCSLTHLVSHEVCLFVGIQLILSMSTKILTVFKRTTFSVCILAPGGDAFYLLLL